MNICTIAGEARKRGKQNSGFGGSKDKMALVSLIDRHFEKNGNSKIEIRFE